MYILMTNGNSVRKIMRFNRIKTRILTMEPVDPVQMNIFQIDTYKKALPFTPYVRRKLAARYLKLYHTSSSIFHSSTFTTFTK